MKVLQYQNKKIDLNKALLLHFFVSFFKLFYFNKIPIGAETPPVSKKTQINLAYFSNLASNYVNSILYFQSYLIDN